MSDSQTRLERARKVILDGLSVPCAIEVDQGQCFACDLRREEVDELIAAARDEGITEESERMTNVALAAYWTKVAPVIAEARELFEEQLATRDGIGYRADRPPFRQRVEAWLKKVGQ